MKKQQFLNNLLAIHILLIVILTLAINIKCFNPNTVQRRRLSDICNSHENAINQAFKDIKNNNIFIFSYGLELSDEAILQEEQRYGFKLIHLGCMYAPHLRTYDQITRRYLNEKYGKKLFKNLDRFNLEKTKSTQ
ncbi:MAG: hypothetical protein RLZZ628_1695 [Bacteroidota bacterium]|jgi:hypothetical protein